MGMACKMINQLYIEKLQLSDYGNKKIFHRIFNDRFMQRTRIKWKIKKIIKKN